MSKNIGTDANIARVRVAEQGSNPSTPATGFGYLFEKTDQSLYFLNASGTVIQLNTSALVQRVSYQTGSFGTTTTAIPLDDTIPQNNEGSQFMAVTIVPTNSGNNLYIDVTIWATISTAGWINVALFQDNVASALSAAGIYIETATAGATVHLHYKMVAGTTSATTFKVRIGPYPSGTVTFNGNSGARLFGGVASSSIIVDEIKV